MGRATPADDVLLRSYRATTWRVRTPATTLTVRIGEPSPLRESGIVTAYNPASHLRPRRENRAANRLLLHRLSSWSRSCFPALALGVGPDAASWREPGFCVAAHLASLVDLAGAFGQNAIVWIDEVGIARLVSARDGFAGARAGTVV